MSPQSPQRYLATAVFLDAFVVRSVLLPAVLALAGERTWWRPRSVERRLPRVAIEPSAHERPAPSGAGMRPGRIAEEPA